MHSMRIYETCGKGAATWLLARVRTGDDGSAWVGGVEAAIPVKNTPSVPVIGRFLGPADVSQDLRSKPRSG